jgi:type IV secretory pathway TraG/TraD family ATPase VirD4
MVRIAGSASLVKRAAQLRPGLARPKVTELGYVLGSARGVACYMSVEDSAVVLGPPRSGKGLHVVIPLILDAPGALVTTSTRPDNLACTVAARATGGRPVALFDPQGLAPGLGSSTRWSPIRGCESPQVAMIRARALCADAGNGTESAPFWSQQTIAAVRCLLHAAALGGREPVDLYAWSLSPAAARDAVSILMSHPGAARAWDEALQAIVSADQRERDSTWAMVANTFAALADPGVLDAVSPGPEEDFDPARFLAERGSLYLLGTASGAGATSGLVGAFVEDIVETARRLAAASPGARLDPPAALVLDEAANYCLPSLGSLMSEGGGTGITTVAVLQSLAQARDRWGRDAAQAIWDSAIVKVVLGGGSNAGDLSDLSRLIGERDAPEHSESWSGSDRRRSVSLSRRQRPILSSDALRRLPFGSALLLLLRNAKPIVLELSPWTGRRDAKLLAAARRQAEDAIRLGSAARIDVRPHRTPAAGRSSPDDDAARAAAPTGARRHASNPKHHRPTRPRSTP